MTTPEDVHAGLKAWMQIARLANLASIGGVLLFLAARAAAQSVPLPPLPPVDLGQTNILDGEGKPGGLFEAIGFGSIAGRLTDRAGNDVAGRNHQRIGSLVAHPIWVASPTVWGAHPGVEILVPVTHIENDFAGTGSGHASGLGDVTVAPFLQWSPAPAAGALSARLALQVVAPTGERHASDAVNVGQGSAQVSPYLAVTWRVSDRWEMSARAIYDWSGATSQPTVQGSRIEVRPGALAAINLSTSYAWTQTLRLGVGGYALRQLTASSAGDVDPAGGRQQVYAAGPVVRWEQGGVVLLFAAFDEFGAHNRPEGVTFNVRLQKPF